MNYPKNYTFVGVVLVAALLFSTHMYKLVFSVPSTFPSGKNFTINENETLKTISERLKEEGYIESPLFFRAGVSFLGKDKVMVVGGYKFDKPLSLLGVLDTFAQGKPTAPLLSVTIPEGSTSFEVAAIVAKALPTISTDIFGEMISKYNADGKLFPSTYFLLPSYSAEDIVKLMLTTFTKKLAVLPKESLTIKAPLANENDVIVLASILEGEAKTKEDMQIVAGILLKRLTIGMPLQVDVAKETYKKRGLPQTPINNPGLTAIEAVLHPVSTNYLYYITGNDGKMYYAETFDEHKQNIKKYLK